jgi:hypothetical protein
MIIESERVNMSGILLAAVQAQLELRDPVLFERYVSILPSREQFL